MPSTWSFRDRTVTPENAAVAVAIVFVMIGAYTIWLRVGGFAPAYLGLLISGVSPLKTSTSRGLFGERIITAVWHIIATCLITYVTYTGVLFLIGDTNTGRVGVVGAFMLTTLATEAVSRVLIESKLD
jgi:hypothetical protein